MIKPLPKPDKQSGLFAAFFNQPYLLLVLAPLFWGGNITTGKIAVGEVDPFVLLIGRWAGATAILLTIGIPYLRRDWARIKPALPILMLYGALGFASFNILMYVAAQFTTAVNASIEQAAIPVLVLLGNFLIFKVRAKPLQVLGLILTILGVIWVATHGDPRRLLSADINIGDGMVLAACLCYAIYSLLLKYNPSIHWLSFILVTAASALGASLIFLLIFGGGPQRFMAVLPNTTPIGWLCILYVMTFPSILAQLCYARGVQLIGPNRASIFINLLPVFGTILSVLIIGETFELYHITASALVVCGIVLAEYAVRRKTSNG